MCVILTLSWAYVVSVSEKQDDDENGKDEDNYDTEGLILHHP